MFAQKSWIKLHDRHTDRCPGGSIMKQNENTEKKIAVTAANQAKDKQEVKVIWQWLH